VNENETPEPETEEVVEEEPKAIKLTTDDVKNEIKRDTVDLLDRVQDAGLQGFRILGETVITRGFRALNAFVDEVTGKKPPKE